MIIAIENPMFPLGCLTALLAVVMLWLGSKFKAHDEYERCDQLSAAAVMLLAMSLVMIAAAIAKDLSA